MRIPDPIVTTTRYEVSCLPADHPWRRHFTITVEYRSDGQWVSSEGGAFLAADGTWSWGYSWRDGSQGPKTDAEHREVQEGYEAWKATHRFDLDTALALARKHAPLMKVNGRTVADALERQETAR